VGPRQSSLGLFCAYVLTTLGSVWLTWFLCCTERKHAALARAESVDVLYNVGDPSARALLVNLMRRVDELEQKQEDHMIPDTVKRTATGARAVRDSEKDMVWFGQQRIEHAEQTIAVIKEEEEEEEEEDEEGLEPEPETQLQSVFAGASRLNYSRPTSPESYQFMAVRGSVLCNEQLICGCNFDCKVNVQLPHAEISSIALRGIITVQASSAGRAPAPLCVASLACPGETFGKHGALHARLSCARHRRFLVFSWLCGPLDNSS
jgi:hypothetical protein